MEMMRNPAAMQQAMRNQDLQMSQIENMPGGFNALRRMYEEVQEPMMESAANAANRPTSTSTTSSYATPSSSSAPNSSALPNPWGAPATAPGGGVPGMSPFGMGAPPAFNPYGGMGGMGGMPPGMDPAQMAAMMDNPMMQQMMQQMMNDPAFIQQVNTAIINYNLYTRIYVFVLQIVIKLSSSPVSRYM